MNPLFYSRLVTGTSGRTRPARRSERGAVFVEAILVISVLTLGLTGIVFFRELYEKRLGVMRLARASAVAHSMVGCVANQHRDWVGRDLGRYETTDPQRQGQPARPRNSSGAATAAADDGGRTTRLLGNTGATGSDGEGLLNPITSTGLSGQSRVGAGSALSTARRSGFEARVQSQSFVTCGEEIKESDYD